MNSAGCSVSGIEQVAHQARRSAARSRRGRRRREAFARPTLIASSARRTSMPCVARLRASRSARDGSWPGTSTYSRIGALLAFGHRAAAVLEEVAHQPLAVARRGDRGGDRGVEVVHHAVAIGQHCAVAARERQRRGPTPARRSCRSSPGTVGHCRRSRDRTRRRPRG